MCCYIFQAKNTEIFHHFNNLRKMYFFKYLKLKTCFLFRTGNH